MIKIVPWVDRKLTKKNLAKIWNLFPNEDICMIDIPEDYNKMQWAKVIARYYVLRHKNFSIEIEPINRMRHVEEFLKIGVKVFYFTWKGLYNGLFFSRLDTLSYAIGITERYPDVKIYIVYTPPYDVDNYAPDVDWLETSLAFMSHQLLEKPNIRGVLRRPHPWFGNKRTNILCNLERFAEDFINIDVENRCGCFTILPNTNIYCCPFCERKKRKKLFGDADRDKFVVGTIDRGVFRNIDCMVCKKKKGKITHTCFGGDGDV